MKRCAPLLPSFHIPELSAAVATVFQVRDELWCRKAVSFVDNKAACASLSRGEAKDRMAMTLVYTMRSIAARYDLAFWIERAQSILDPADLLLRSQKLSFDTEPRREIATLGDISAFHDAS